LGSSICKLAVLLFLQAAIPNLPQEVSGRIVRPGVRRMDPVTGAWVVLHRVGSDGAGPLDSLQSDARGRFSFKYQRTGSADAVYFVSAMYDGIAYFTPPLPEGKVSGENGEITVFDTTSGHVPITLQGHHVVVSAVDANSLRTVVEVYDLSNDSSVTRVAAGDNEIDALYHQIFSEVLELMRQDPVNVDRGTRILFAAKNLERIGDRVTNIAEDVVFLATGDIEDLNP